MTMQVNVQQAKTHLSRLLDRAVAGEEVVIARSGRPVARLVAVEPPARRRLGFLGMEVPDDFDAPLPEEELPGVGVSDAALLDTHVLLWALADPARLSGPARSRVEDPTGRLLVSAASAWEIATKHRLGRLPEAQVLIASYGEHLAELGVEELPVAGRHGLLAGQLRWDHRDPFDRMLAAQSMLEHVPLVTADQAFTSLPGLTTLW